MKVSHNYIGDHVCIDLCFRREENFFNFFKFHIFRFFCSRPFPNSVQKLSTNLNPEKNVRARKINVYFSELWSLSTLDHGICILDSESTCENSKLLLMFRKTNYDFCDLESEGTTTRNKMFSVRLNLKLQQNTLKIANRQKMERFQTAQFQTNREHFVWMKHRTCKKLSNFCRPDNLNPKSPTCENFRMEITSSDFRRIWKFLNCEAPGSKEKSQNGAFLFGVSLLNFWLRVQQVCGLFFREKVRHYWLIGARSWSTIQNGKLRAGRWLYDQNTRWGLQRCDVHRLQVRRNHF